MQSRLRKYLCNYVHIMDSIMIIAQSLVAVAQW
jgi:hypothetical protein